MPSQPITIPSTTLWTAGTHNLGNFTPQPSDSQGTITLNIPTADYETAGNSISMNATRVSDGMLVIGDDPFWANPNGGPVVAHVPGGGTVTDPAPSRGFDLSPWKGQPLNVSITVAQTMHFGATISFA